MKIPCKYERLENCSKEDLINKIIVRDKHCNDLKGLLDKGLKKYKELEEENKMLKSDLEEADKAKMNALNGMSDLSKFGLKQIKKLEQENAELKSELSKFSEAYKKYRDYEKEELAESCYDLARENEKLKEEIGKLVMNGK